MADEGEDRQVTNILRKVERADEKLMNERVYIAEDSVKKIYIQRRAMILATKGAGGKIVRQGEGQRGERYTALRRQLLRETRYSGRSPTARVRGSHRPSTPNTLRVPAPTAHRPSLLAPSSASAPPSPAPDVLAGPSGRGCIYSFRAAIRTIQTRSASITTVRFAHNDAERVAFASQDGVITIVKTSDEAFEQVLTGHTRGVSDVDWSSSNDYLLSASLDMSARVWQVETGECVRVIACTTELLCGRFLPHNDNAFVVGGVMKEIQMYNMSTGLLVTRVKVGASTGALTFNYIGNRLFVGDQNGVVYIFELSARQDKLRKLRETPVVKTKRGISSLAYNIRYQRGSQEHFLLLNCKNSTVQLFSVDEDLAKLTLKRTFQINQTVASIRSMFCPLISPGAQYIVSGGEEGNVSFFNADRDSAEPVLSLRHGRVAVLDVSWAYDETALASCDASGKVILWRRV